MEGGAVTDDLAELHTQIDLSNLIRALFNPVDARPLLATLGQMLNPTKPYPEELADTLTDFHDGATVISVKQGLVTELLEAIMRLEVGGTEVYVEIDRASLHEILDGTKGAHHLLPYFIPTAVRLDEQGDIIIHITDAERARS
jgi:hypothetical protein